MEVQEPNHQCKQGQQLSYNWLVKEKLDLMGEVTILVIKNYLNVLNLMFVSPESLLLVMLLPVDNPLPHTTSKMGGLAKKRSL